MTEPVAATTSDRPEDEVRAGVLAIVLDMAPNPDGEQGPETNLIQDLGYHSLALMEVAFALEDEFDLDPIDEKSARKITTVKAVQDFVIEKLQERPNQD